MDRIIEQWQRERPDLDVSPLGAIGRLHRVGAQLERELLPIFAEEGLGQGDFDVLATLRRAGEPYEATPSRIAATSMITSGAATKRIARLERAGLVTRRASESDGRVQVIGLTPEGRELMDRLVERHVANEHRLVGMLEPADREHLARILRSWALALGDGEG
ncbi:MarR family transcriptional regulator [Nocardioides dubius]|uniref:MarR family winged helix-turn-helix transcriptional regulator n=1 Tax=Nocardioides dubius TaxID=317019 RepID=UPI0031D3D627